MKIIRMTAENIKRLLVVEIEPTGRVIKISGKNGAGKTSVLDAIWWALGGVRNVQDQPVREGQKKASVRLDLGDLIITRRFNTKDDGGYTTSLTVENATNGARYQKAQAMLDGLVGRLAFDPLEFIRMDQHAQLATLKDLAGLDTAKLDAEAKRVYEERTNVNRDATRLRGAMDYDRKQLPEDHATEEQSATDVMAKVGDARAHNHAIEQGLAAVGRAKEKLAEIAEQTQAAVAEQELAETALKELGPPADVNTLEEQARTLETGNAQARMYQRMTANQDELKKVERRAKSCSTRLANIELRKADMVKDSKLPLPGLALGDDCVLYGDVPLDQAGSAEQLRVGMAVAMALHPELRVIRITDGSLLDADSMAVIEGMAAGEDWQVWVEVVDETGKVGVVIEDGQVAKVNK